MSFQLYHTFNKKHRIMSFGKLVQSATNYIKQETGIGGTVDRRLGKLNETKVPWDGVGSAKDGFFPALEIKEDRWNGFYPYRLIVIDVTKGNAPIKGSAIIRTQTLAGSEYVLSQESIGGDWVYNFPITPQSISISDQYAINTMATMRGIIEEHNGVVFKNISMSGTTGIWPQKPTIAGIPKQPGIVSSFFGNTLEASLSTLRQAGKLAQSATGKGNSTVAQKPENTDSGLTSTGYYQALFLGQFLERYAIAKKNPENKGWRLVLDIQKENQSFVVTPSNFSLQKSQQSPMEYIWSLQLKAWKRITINQVIDQKIKKPLSLGDPNILQRISNTLRDTRRTLSSSINLIKAVRSDFQAPLNSLRQAALAVKDLGGLAFTVIDLPSNIVKDYQSSIEESLFINRNAFNRGPSGGGVGASSTGTVVPLLKSTSQFAKAGNAVNSITSKASKNEGLSSNFVSQGALGTEASQSAELDPLNDVFQNSEGYFDLFDSLDLSALKLTPQQQQVIEDEFVKISLINIDDLNKIKKEMLDLSLDISNNFGTGSESFSQIYDRPAPQSRVTPISLEEYEILNSIYEAVQALDLLTATKFFDDTKRQNPLEYVGGLANENGIEFDESTSKYLVPVPFGLSIEEIAMRYLGNPDKWVEIATLNSLRSPYIDEDGFSYDLLSNASGRSFNVNDNQQRLFIGQRIVLKSLTVPPFSRKIINIEKISDTNYLISVDGTSNLDNLTIADDASLRAYLPGTVNSQDQIYIPSDLPSQEDDRVAEIPSLKNDKLTKISKVDWLLDDSGDIAINNLGDFRLANGLNNLVQALKMKISVSKNSLLRHPDFGLGIKHGVSIADIDSGSLFQELNKLVTDDPRFSGLERLDITISGGTITVDMAVSVAGNSGIVPISFNV